MGGIEAQRASSGGGEAGLVEDPPTGAVVRGVVDGRTASIGQRFARRLNRLLAKAARWQRRGERRAARAENLRDARPDVEPEGRAIEPFVSRTLIYLATFGLVVLTLEGAGMWTSLSAYDGLIGSYRIPMSIAAGAILTLAGHGIGHLLSSAVEERRLRLALLAGAVTVLLAGVLTVISLGAGRDANTRAADRFAQVGKLEGRAQKLEREAKDLREPAPTLPGAETPEPTPRELHEAEGLSQKAEGLQRKAEQVEEDAREERTLGFFAWIQILGLGVGAIGGYYFACAAAVREYKRLTSKAGREDRRASRRFSWAERWQAKADDVMAKVGRLVLEETAWGEAVFGRFEEVRLKARGFSASSRSHPWQGRSESDLQDDIARAIRPVDLNGGGPIETTKSEEE